MNGKHIDPPIPLPDFDPYEQLGKARDRIRELAAKVDAVEALLLQWDHRPESYAWKYANEIRTAWSTVSHEAREGK